MRLLIPEMITLHEDAFYEFFRPYRHKDASHDIWGGIGLETFGDDLELVKSLPVESVWTVVDGDDTDQWILTGIHTINRICYLITEVPHDWQENSVSDSFPRLFADPHRPEAANQ